MRTVIYARFSSDNQNPRSVDDQIAVCRERAKREGWPVVATFEDSAISGAAGIGEDQRPGLNAMLKLVASGGVDQVLAESTDRLSRHVADAHIIRERIEFAGARLFTLFDGTVTPIVALVKGFTDSQFRSDLAARVKRGKRAAVMLGRASGGQCFGYRRANRLDEKGEIIRGLREIDEDQADTVRRIFREFAAGQSPAAIAGRLNAEGIPPPRRGFWQPTTIRGDKKNGHGLLKNRLYVGKLVYGRTKVVTNPVTRRQLMRPNTEEALTEQDVPHLRIISDDLWRDVQAKLEATSGASPERQRRPKHLLSGLGVCGVCGSGWVKITGENWGCRRYRTGNDCANNRNIASRPFERRVLADLRERMLAPEVVSAYLREYHRDYARQIGELSQNRTKLERQLADATRKMERMVKAFAEGGSEFAEIRAMLADARDEKDRLTRELASLDALPDVLTLHPNLEAEYRRQVEELQAALAEPEAALEAVPRLRAMIARIVVTPARAGRGVEIEVVRQMDEILSVATGARSAMLR